MAFVALWRQLRAAHRGGPTLRARLRALPRMTVASLRRRYDGLWRLALMGIAFLYVLWPLDLMPVLLLGPVGLIDDAAAAGRARYPAGSGTGDARLDRRFLLPGGYRPAGRRHGET